MSPTSKTSFMAVWFALPPIQLPATVVIPRHTASGPAPPTVSGLNALTARMASGPPATMPMVPVAKRVSAFGPSLSTDGRSTERVSMTRQAGSRYRELT